MDAGESRAALIPKSRNLAGFPDGINGKELLSRMRTQAEKYGTTIKAGRVTNICREGDRFGVEADGERITARTVLLASGVIDGKLPVLDLEQAIKLEFVRYCPICDGYEARDLRIAVIGQGGGALEEALFIRTYSDDVTLLSLGRRLGLDASQQERVKNAHIKAVDEEVTKIEIQPPRIVVATGNSNSLLVFDTLYSSLGSKARNALVRPLGVSLFEDNCIEVDPHMKTNIEGLYAVGDVIKGVDQISTALGNSAIASTAIHNYLRKIEDRSPGTS